MKDYEFKLLVIHNLRNYVTNDKSKDGLGHALFPLTSALHLLVATLAAAIL
jgi:hypothetical protein